MGDLKGQKQILLVEDSPTQARYAGLLLEDADYRVSVATTGTAGIEKAISDMPDLIILDVVLPDLDGFSVCRRLRHQLMRYVPIIMLTEERTAVEDKLDGFSVGADDYLSKPYDPRELLARISSLIRIKEVIDELYGRLANEHQSYQALKHIALVDQLTGLYNRHYFNEVITREFSSAQRYSNPLSCLITDIDHFRDFNNRYGHLAGDWVLQNVAELIRSMLRNSDILARYGGEEFIAILPMTAGNNAAELAERIRFAVADRSWKHPEFGVFKITLSAGVAALPMQHIESPLELVNCADQALYRAKDGGRNRIELFIVA